MLGQHKHSTQKNLLTTTTSTARTLNHLQHSYTWIYNNHTDTPNRILKIGEIIIDQKPIKSAKDQ